MAAGAGTRLGRPKALVELDGRLLVDRGVTMLRAGGCDPVVVVLGASAREVVIHADLTGAVVVVNDRWSSGIGSSLRTGLAALTDLRAPAALVALVDQPRVTADVVRRLVSAPSDAPALVASYDGRPGNPVRLAATIWPEVCELAVGDVGARAWMRAHPDQVIGIACDDLGDDHDVDTPEDLSRLGGSGRMERDA
ncbi:MAG TPA: nucleotidyltransferase family protein [Mycobacteriales bacterium]|nr:nucleotidyltransferase family protein [Mycobacteriales bacterium]